MSTVSVYSYYRCVLGGGERERESESKPLTIDLVFRFMTSSCPMHISKSAMLVLMYDIIKYYKCNTHRIMLD